MKAFTHHPAAVGMTYLQHCGFSLSLSRMFFVGAFQAFVHGIFPFVFERASTEQSVRIIRRIAAAARDRSLRPELLAS